MESRFGRDFSAVRVHTSEAAGKLAQNLDANAFTVGTDIGFGARQYTPNTRKGRRQLAHELAHVVQQSGRSANNLYLGARFHERGAVAAAKAFDGGSDRIDVRPATGIELALEPKADDDGPESQNVLPPVPQFRHTPFTYLIESPDRRNWEIAATKVLSRHFKKDFSTFREAEDYFRAHLNTLPDAKDREAFAVKMRDVVRKAFYRLEGRSPSYAYSREQTKRLKRGASPVPTQQLEHMEEIKTKTRGGGRIIGKPERGLSTQAISSSRRAGRVELPRRVRCMRRSGARSLEARR